jgi:hypothetical protein
MRCELLPSSCIVVVRRVRVARRVVLFGICVYAIRAFTSGPGHLAVRLTYRAVARTGARDLLRFKAGQ